MTINQDCDEGGTFSATLPVTSKLIFTKVGMPSEQRVLDYGIEGLGPLSYNITDGHWLYEDHGFSVITFPFWISVDHDCNVSTPDVLVGRSSNFFPGLRAIPCNSCPGQPSDYEMLTTLWQSSACGSHSVLPPQGYELCQKYLKKYSCCVELQNAGRNLIMSVRDAGHCYNQADQAACVAAGCYWHATKGRCVLDMCLGDANFDGKVSGTDGAAVNKDFGRLEADCPCN